MSAFMKSNSRKAKILSDNFMKSTAHCEQKKFRVFLTLCDVFLRVPSVYTPVPFTVTPRLKPTLTNLHYKNQTFFNKIREVALFYLHFLP